MNELGSVTPRIEREAVSCDECLIEGSSGAWRCRVLHEQSLPASRTAHHTLSHLLEEGDKQRLPQVAS